MSLITEVHFVMGKAALAAARRKAERLKKEQKQKRGMILRAVERADQLRRECGVTRCECCTRRAELQRVEDSNSKRGFWMVCKPCKEGLR